MMKSSKNILGPQIVVLLILIGLGWSCDKYFPEERENIGEDSQYTQELFEPVLGRNNSYSVFFKGTTTYPATFQIKNIRRRNGEPAPELQSILPVTVWKNAYTGKETSLEELKAKQEVQNRPVLEVAQYSGDIIMWNTARSNFIRALPDSGYLFDIEVSSSGGRRFFRDLKLMPYRERPTEPSNRDATNGHELSPGVFAASLLNVKGDSTNRYMSSGDLMISMKRMEGSNDSKITFRFLDKNGQLINPNKFSKTNWNNLVHGFNPVITSTGVTYDVLYPIPLVKIKTEYTTTDGDRAVVTFSYERIGFGGVIETAIIRFPFAIYESGNWEVLFQFVTDNPKFSNE
ncbi:MAG TPA: DUF5007 domain-containing protein [Niabella sp.]|nr:DUF5007 domain-containing protein [Niabella sp.]